MIRKMGDFVARQYVRPNQDDRGLRANRGRFVCAILALTLGVLVLLWTSPVRNEFIVPGPLISSHAQILAAAGSDRCASCHGAANQSFTDLMHDAFSGGANLKTSQCDLCMSCHNQTLNTQWATKAHNVPPQALAKITDGLQRVTNPFMNVSLGSPANQQEDIACSTCHREHHGNADLTAMTDRQCQTCHSQQFQHFAKGHPEFASWPDYGRRNIAFDHATHMAKHFPESKTQFDCNQCHIDDGFGNVKLLAPFASSCAKCHEEDIQQSGQTGWTLFALPILDQEAIQAAGLSIGQWPESALGDFDGPLPPPLRTLLYADPIAAKALDQLGTNFDFYDVDPEDHQQVRCAVDVAWGIKQLLFDLGKNGRDEIASRLMTVLGREISPEEIEGLMAGLDASAFEAAAKKWLPDLEDEVRRRPHSSSKRLSWLPEADDVLARLETQDDQKLIENPLKHLRTQTTQENDGPSAANPPVALRSNPPQKTVAETPSPAPASPRFGKPGDGPLLVPNPLADSGLKNLPPETNAPNPVQVNDSTHRPNRLDASGLATNPVRPEFTPDENAGEKLTENPLKGLRPHAGESPDAGWVETPLDSGPQPGDLALEPSHDDLPNQLRDAGDVSPQSKLQDAIVRLASKKKHGGWYRNDQTMEISYQLDSHADPVFRAWTELAVNSCSEENQNALGDLLAQLDSESAPGNCRSCHAAQADSRGIAGIAWRPEYRDTSRRGFTKFSHQPHLTQTSMRDCQSCHRLHEDSPSKTRLVSATLSGNQPHGDNHPHGLSDFEPISITSCVECHRPGGASSGCTDCHNYHVGGRYQIH